MKLCLIQTWSLSLACDRKQLVRGENEFRSTKLPSVSFFQPTSDEASFQLACVLTYYQPAVLISQKSPSYSRSSLVQILSMLDESGAKTHKLFSSVFLETRVSPSKICFCAMRRAQQCPVLE